MSRIIAGFVGCASMAIWLSAAETPENQANSARAKVEFRLAEEEPRADLVEIVSAEGKKKWYLHKEVVITNDHIAKSEAVQAPMEMDDTWEVTITFTKEGIHRFAEATGKNIGKALAIVVDDKLIMAPIIRDKIETDTAVISSGPQTKEEALRFARRIYPEAVAIPRQPRKLIEGLELVEYTDDEYAALKVEREKSGLYYLDRAYSPEELDKLLKKGMTPVEVKSIFGTPSHVINQKINQKVVLNWSYELAPEKHPVPRQAHNSGVSLGFIDDQLVFWGVNTSTFPRELRRKFKEQPELKMIYTPLGFSKGMPSSSEYVKFLESIKLEDTKHQMNLPDTVGVLGIAMQAGYFKNMSGEEVIISGNCDLVKLLEANFAEVAQYDWPGKKEKDRGKVEMSKLKDLLEPYQRGDKPLPCQARKGQ